MLAAGVGLTGAGAYLIYNGMRVYNASLCDSLSIGGCNIDKERETNHKQGTIFLVCGGLSCALGVALTSVGAVKKVQFKRRKKELLIQPTGSLSEVGVRFTF